MKRYLVAAAAVCLVTSAIAQDMIATDGKDSVRLTQAECPQSILTLMRPEYREKVKAAVATVNGKEFRGCWMVQPGGVISLLYEDGDLGMVPMKDFKQAPGA